MQMLKSTMVLKMLNNHLELKVFWMIIQTQLLSNLWQLVRIKLQRSRKLFKLIKVKQIKTLVHKHLVKLQLNLELKLELMKVLLKLNLLLQRNK